MFSKPCSKITVFLTAEKARNTTLVNVQKTADPAASYDTISAALENTLNAAALAYRGAAFGAWEDLLDETADNYKIFAHNQERIDHGGTVADDAFENPTFDYEVCFAAGTQVLMADGTTKSIELIRPGDLVLAAHHLNPEERPTAAKVVRFFDNGEKDVVKLLFSNLTVQVNIKPSEATPQEIVCTPGHRFYVVGKGWIHAQELRQGDFCLSADGEKVAFLSREKLIKKQRVYNFEVEGKHTYYIGKKEKFSLVHNEGCWDSISNGAYIIRQIFVGMGQGLANTASGIVNHFGVNYVNGIAYVEEKFGILNSNPQIRIPYIPEASFFQPSPTETLGQQIAEQYFIPWDSGIHNFIDDGILEQKSCNARKEFLLSWALQHGAKADGISREFILSDWTSVFQVDPSINKFYLSNTNTFLITNPDFWIGTMHDFQAKGSFCITIPANKDEYGISIVHVNNMDITWKLIDRIDANSFLEYNWKENSIQQGILERLTDIIGDKFFGMSFDINIIFHNHKTLMFDYILNNLYK